MKKYLFKADKNLYKANLHCHTTNSDGKHTPEEIKSLYTEKGYSVVAFTDHRKFIPHSHLNDPGFLALDAVEMNLNESGKEWVNIKTYHFCLIATRPGLEHPPALEHAFDYFDIESLNKYIATVNDLGFLVVYNHPYWSLQDYNDYYELDGIFAVEIYNHGSETEGHYGHTPQVYDELLRRGTPLFCVATDDNHNRAEPNHPQYDSFGGWIQINSPSLKYEDIITSMQSGDFYASCGPEIYEISLEDNQLRVKCSEVDTIAITTHNRRCLVRHKEPDSIGLTEAEFTLSGKEEYIRVTCCDKNKKNAHSNAFWMSEGQNA